MDAGKGELRPPRHPRRWHRWRTPLFQEIPRHDPSDPHGPAATVRGPVGGARVYAAVRHSTSPATASPSTTSRRSCSGVRARRATPSTAHHRCSRRRPPRSPGLRERRGMAMGAAPHRHWMYPEGDGLLTRGVRHLSAATSKSACRASGEPSPHQRLSTSSSSGTTTTSPSRATPRSLFSEDVVARLRGVRLSITQRSTTRRTRAGDPRGDRDARATVTGTARGFIALAQPHRYPSPHRWHRRGARLALGEDSTPTKEILASPPERALRRRRRRAAHCARRWARRALARGVGRALQTPGPQHIRTARRTLSVLARRLPDGWAENAPDVRRRAKLATLEAPQFPHAVADVLPTVSAAAPTWPAATTPPSTRRTRTCQRRPRPGPALGHPRHAMGSTMTAWCWPGGVPPVRLDVPRLQRLLRPAVRLAALMGCR